MPTPTNKAIFAPQYYGTVYYYAMIASCSHAVIDTNLRYDKRFKSVHRTTIADTQGYLNLTVPLSHITLPIDTPFRKWRDFRVSSHGDWWADHRISLESAYGRTPFFEFYIDRFMPWLCDSNIPITDFNIGIDQEIRRTLGLTAEVSYDTKDVDPSEYMDYRKNNFSILHDIPYYQIRADRLGFMPGLSILDLLFNMGPESPIILNKMLI